MRRLLLAPLGLLLASFTACPGDLSEALRLYGHTPVRPASTFWQPGALVYVRKYDPMEVGYICSASQVMGATYKPMQSPTLNADLARATRKAHTFSTEFMDVISGDADLHAIKSVKMSLRNARLFEINDSDIDGRTSRVDPACIRNLVRRRRQGYAITMISSALQADVVYTVQFDKGVKLDANGQIATLQNLALKLGVEASAVGARTIEAKGLIWGIRDDAYLAHLFDPVHLDRVDRRNSRLIDPQQAPELTTGYDDLRRPSLAPSQQAEPLGTPSSTSTAPDSGTDEEVDDTYLPLPSDGQADGLSMHELGRGARARPAQEMGDIVQPQDLAGADIFRGIEAAVGLGANANAAAAPADPVVVNPAPTSPVPANPAVANPLPASPVPADSTGVNPSPASPVPADSASAPPAGSVSAAPIAGPGEATAAAAPAADSAGATQSPPSPAGATGVSEPAPSTPAELAPVPAPSPSVEAATVDADNASIANASAPAVEPDTGATSPSEPTNASATSSGKAKASDRAAGTQPPASEGGAEPPARPSKKKAPKSGPRRSGGRRNSIG